MYHRGVHPSERENNTDSFKEVKDVQLSAEYEEKVYEGGRGAQIGRLANSKENSCCPAPCTQTNAVRIKRTSALGNQQLLWKTTISLRIYWIFRICMDVCFPENSFKYLSC